MCLTWRSYTRLVYRTTDGGRHPWNAVNASHNTVRWSSSSISWLKQSVQMWFALANPLQVPLSVSLSWPRRGKWWPFSHWWHGWEMWLGVSCHLLIGVKTCSVWVLSFHVLKLFACVVSPARRENFGIICLLCFIASIPSLIASMSFTLATYLWVLVRISNSGTYYGVL